MKLIFNIGFLKNLGYYPYISICDKCGKNEIKDFYYILKENFIYCINCRNSRNDLLFNHSEKEIINYSLDLTKHSKSEKRIEVFFEK